MYQTAGSMYTTSYFGTKTIEATNAGTLARDESVTPGVACLTDGTLTDGEYPCSLSPSFDSATHFVKIAVKPTFVFNPLRRISDPPELTFGHSCFPIESVPPQPNYPPAAVPFWGQQYETSRVV